MIIGALLPLLELPLNASCKCKLLINFDKKNLVEIAKISGIFVFLVIFKPAIFIATKLLKESFAAIFLTT